MGDPDAKDHEDYKWLVARERGEDIGPVLAADRAPYEKLGELLGSGLKPSAGFRQRVLDEIDAAEAAKLNGHTAPEPPDVSTDDPMAVADAIRADSAELPVIVPAEPPERTEPVKATTPAPADALRAPEKAEAPVVPIHGRKKRSPWIVGGVAVLAVAAVLVVYVATRRPSRTTPVLALSSKVERGGDVVRGPSDQGVANVGDILVFEAQGNGPTEIRVYGGPLGENPLARCGDGVPADASCTIQRDGEARELVFRLKLRYEARGTVSAVLFAGERIPEPTALLSRDLGAAAEANVQTKQDQSWRVR
jgi:hypothetical protein